jgi:hypothetical protein
LGARGKKGQLAFAFAAAGSTTRRESVLGGGGRHAGWRRTRVGVVEVKRRVRGRGRAELQLANVEVAEYILFGKQSWL